LPTGAGKYPGSCSNRPATIGIARSRRPSDRRQAYLNRQYTTIGVVGVILFLVIGPRPGLGWATAWDSRSVRSWSGATGYIGMNISVRATCVPLRLHGSVNEALTLAFRGGAITASSSWASAARRRRLLRDHSDFSGARCRSVTSSSRSWPWIRGSLISIFARSGGGIFTKGADVGADLVGKVEAGIPGDPRNPRDRRQRRRQVGDCAGMAQTSSSFRGDLDPTMLARALMVKTASDAALIYPLAVGRVSDHRFHYRLHVRQSAAGKRS